MAHLRRAGGALWHLDDGHPVANAANPSDGLLNFYLEELGAFYAFFFQYMPIGRYPNLDWMPSPDQRIPSWNRSWEVVANGDYPVDF